MWETLFKKYPLIRHNLVFMSGSLVVSLLNYLFYPVLGRMLSPADFGEVQILNSLFLQTSIFLAILSYISIHVTVNVADVDIRNKTLLGLERTAMIAGYTVLAIALLSIHQLRDFFNFEESLPFTALIAALGFSIPLVMRMAFLRGRKKYFLSTATDAIGSFVKLILAPVLVFFGFRSFGAISALALSQLLSLVAGSYWAQREGLGDFSFSKDSLHLNLIKPYFKHGAAILFGAGGITLAQSLDAVTIKHYFPAEIAGKYAGISIISNIVLFVMGPITGVLLTLVNTNDSHQLNQRRLYASLGIMLCTGGSALLAMSVFPSIIIKILVGSKYITYSYLLPRLGLGMLFLGLSSAFTMYHIANKRYKYTYASIVVFLILLGLMRVRHGTIDMVANNIVIGSTLLLMVTASQNILFSRRVHRQSQRS